MLMFIHYTDISDYDVVMPLSRCLYVANVNLALDKDSLYRKFKNSLRIQLFLGSWQP